MKRGGGDDDDAGAMRAATDGAVASAMVVQASDALVVFDGRGGQYPATISAVERKRVTVAITGHDPLELESPLHVHLAIGMLHAGEAHRGEGDGHRHILSDHLAFGAAARHVDSHALAQADVIEITAVLPERLLGP